MKYFKTTIVVVSSICLCSAVFSQDRDKFTRKLQSAIDSALQRDQLTAWVFFTDKGPDISRRLEVEESKLSPRNRKRRLRHRRSRLVDQFDLPVSVRYREHVARLSSRVRHTSRWLNAVSVHATPSQLAELAHLEFVAKIDIVHRGKVIHPVHQKEPAPKLSSVHSSQALDYGPSLGQNLQINVPSLHEKGLDGTGVIIAMLDAGFNFLEHDALDHLNILATRDFVNGDNNVDDQPGQMGVGNHGSWTLGVIAGFQEGQLIGPAYGASFILAKTENTDFERHVEEDNWVAAAEWADSLGAEIISSSLGYRFGFTDGEAGYTADQMDGQTAISTIGAEIAASRGILVVNSAGNDGPSGLDDNTLGAPCDGENVLCVGAVTVGGKPTNFSSTGPTADGRTKPEVFAMGSLVLTVDHTRPGSYLNLNGTSFSCPLVAGTAALLLEAFPTATNSLLITILKETANNASDPDNDLGWGVIDGAAAFERLDKLISSPMVERFALLPAFPNPFNSLTTIPYDLPADSHVELKIFNMLGQEIVTLVDKEQRADHYEIPWNGRDKDRVEVSTGLYVYRVRTSTRVESGRVLFLK